MKGNRSFNNLFLSNTSPFQTSATYQLSPSLKDSQYFETSNHFRQQSSVYPFQLTHRFSYHPLYSDPYASIKQNPQQNTVFHESQIPGKQSLLLERSRSQIIQPIYLSPLKKTLRDDLDQSRELTASKTSQITFSKPSEFIINVPKQNVYLDTKKSFISNPGTAADDYGYTFGNFCSINPQMKHSCIVSAPPMKQSYFAETFNPCRNSIVINPKPFQNDTHGPITTINTFTPNKFSGAEIHKNPSSTRFTVRPSIRRCLSNNVSIFSQKSLSKPSQTKIKFNYISPPKIQNKMGRKLSFKKEEANNPLLKLNKKKKLNSKLQQHPRPKIISEVVNQYFPEFKIKKNKIKCGLSPQIKQANAKNFNKNSEKSDFSENSERRNTFIASLDALAQISQLKPIQKNKSSPILTETPKKIPYSVCDYLSTESRNKNSQKSVAFNKISGYRITLDGQKVPLVSPQKEEAPSSKGSQVSKGSQFSNGSMKNGEDFDFVKKNGNDSSHTTDYEDEIVKKIKEDLGLHFSYNKRK